MEQSTRRALRNLPTLDYRALHNRGEAVKFNAMTNSDSDSSSPAEPVASSAAADAGDTMAVKDQQQSAPQASFAKWRHTRSWRSSHTTAIWWWTAPGGSAERRARSRPPRWRRPAECNQDRPVPCHRPGDISASGRHQVWGRLLWHRRLCPGWSW